MKRGISAVIGMSALAACTAVDDQALSRLRPGSTTASQAIAALGTPKRDETLPDGSRMLTYITSDTTMHAENVIPIMHWVWAGWYVDNTEAGLMFGPNGVLRFWSWSSNQSPRIRVVGRDVTPPVVLDHDIKMQDPHPETGTGAKPNRDFLAN